MRVVIALLVVFAISIPASADEPRRIRSNPVSLSDGDFRIEVVKPGDEAVVVLTHASLDCESSVWPIECSLNESLPDDSAVAWSNDDIRQIVAGRYTRSAIIFAVMSEADDDAAIWAGIVIPPSDESAEPTLETFDYLTACDTDDRIISASGIGEMAAFSIFVGEMSGEEPGGMANGIVITSYCPGPVSDARIGRFEATYPPSLWDE